MGKRPIKSLNMKTQVAATYVAGQFKPDDELPLAEDTRVRLIVEVIDDEAESKDEDDEPDTDYDPVQARAAWKRLKERMKKRPIHGGGKRYTRDELYERR